MTLYRQYRPQHFKDVLGQPAAVATLTGALTKQRIGHAYLLTGPRGTGKTSSARIFARAASCLHLLDGGEPCDICQNCLALLQSSSDDFLEIDAASNRGIEDVRLLRESAAYPPHQLPWRIFVIDEVHMLTSEAFNALLKLLEEPPIHCLFLLATTELQKVPLTIRSRCQTISFRSAPVSEIVQKLLRVSEQENITIDPQSLELLAAHAEGGFRDAETLLEQLAAGHSELTEAIVLAELGVLPQLQIDELLTAVLTGSAVAVTTALQAVPAGRSGVIRQLLETIRTHLYAPLPEPGLQLVFEKLLEAYILQRSAPDPRMALEVACFGLCQSQVFTRTIPPAAPAERHALPVPKPARAEPPSSVPVITIIDKPISALPQEELTNIRQAWKEMIEQVCRDNTILGNTLRQGVFHTASTDQITIHVRFKFHVDKFSEKKNQALILGILQKLTGLSWTIIYQINTDLPKRVSNKQIGTGLDDALAVFG